MTEKSRGINYLFGYYDGMNPNRARFTLANRGMVAPKIETACELGFGRGISLAVNAASGSGKWVGTDIEPAQASFAQSLVGHLEDRCEVYAESFQRFNENPAITQFDFICLHGIWTWVNDKDREAICEFIDKKLKPGGLLYISYNALPAWTNFLPIQKLLTSYCDYNRSANKSGIDNLTDSFKFAEGLLNTNPRFLKANPSMGEIVKKIQAKDSEYLIHEYLAADFAPMTFDTMSSWLSPLNMTYVSASNFLHDLAPINLTTEQQEFLFKIKDPVFQETCRDLMVNKDFRQDYWIKGQTPLSPYQKEQALAEFQLILTSNKEDIKYSVKGALGDAELESAIYDPIIELLRDHRAYGYKEIREHLQSRGVDLASSAEALEVLFSMGHLNVISNDADSDAVGEGVAELNDKILNAAFNNMDIGWLASPVIGGGIAVSKFNQLHVRGKKLGCETGVDYAEHGLNFLKKMRQKIIVDNAPIDSEKRSMEYLEKHAEQFLEKVVPIFKALKILT
ncbi:MAG: class I SAM-dependent methyltransferase [Gammaproteobacteria bacterium]|nr:class I SAM-dependent methyltransferase [Gammaproteobacteria bacterium]